LRLNNKHFGELKQTKPLQVILLFMLGKCFISSKNEEDALEQFNKAVEMVNNMKNEYEYDLSNLYRLIVKSLLNQGNPDGAMEFANKIVSGCLGKYGELSTEYSEAIGLLAEVYAKKGESHHSSKILA
jgi:tetratricopeptide (TPR) repeat protein